MYTSLPAVKNHILLIYLSRVRVPEGALKVLILQAANCGVGAFFFWFFPNGIRNFCSFRGDAAKGAADLKRFSMPIKGRAAARSF